MSNPLFVASYSKLNRAAKFIQELKIYTAEFIDSCNKTSRLELEEEQIVAAVDFSDFDLGPSVIVGDTVHNLRAALDLMASEMAQLNGRSGKNVYFPFSNSKSEFPEAIKSKNFNKCGTDAVDLLLKFEPYHGGNVPLRALHDLDIQDKHMALIASQSNAKTTAIFQMKDGALDVAASGMRIDSIALTFPLDSVFAGEEIIATLEALEQLVHSILQAFASLIAARA